MNWQQSLAITVTNKNGQIIQDYCEIVLIMSIGMKIVDSTMILSVGMEAGIQALDLMHLSPILTDMVSEKTKAESVLRRIEKSDLTTPWGVRTLSLSIRNTIQLYIMMEQSGRLSQDGLQFAKSNMVGENKPCII